MTTRSATEARSASREPHLASSACLEAFPSDVGVGNVTFIAKEHSQATQTNTRVEFT